jgi:SAM-dependent methyltransferase
MSAKVPDRVRWAVELLDVQPDDVILEFGGGPGVAARLVADQLVGGRGRLLAIDRSAVAVERTKARNTEHIPAGRVVVEQLPLADLVAEPDTFDKAFCVNVNVFWTSPADAELAVLARGLRPGGALYLVYGEAPDDATRDVAPLITANLERHGFASEVLRDDAGGMLCVIGRPPKGTRRPAGGPRS